MELTSAKKLRHHHIATFGRLLAMTFFCCLRKTKTHKRKSVRRSRLMRRCLFFGYSLGSGAAKSPNTLRITVSLRTIGSTLLSEVNFHLFTYLLYTRNRKLSTIFPAEGNPLRKPCAAGFFRFPCTWRWHRPCGPPLPPAKPPRPPSGDPW